MRVAIFGGTGFVGSHLVDHFVAAGMHPVVLVRPGSEGRVRQYDNCDVVAGDIGDTQAIIAMLQDADAVVFNIGILRESPRNGVTFGALQEDAAIRVIDAAKAHGVKRFLLMSANGVDAGVTTYQKTKLNAERHLQASGPEWTIFRPSVIFGDPRGRMEFATQLKRDIIDSPLPAPLFFAGLNPSAAGLFELSPVHVGDVAAAFTKALQQPQTAQRVLHLGGPETLSWRRILGNIAEASGKRKTMLPVPAMGVNTAAALFDRWERFPITRDQIRMLLQGNSCSPADLEQLGIEPIPFSASNLEYLTSTNEETPPWLQNAA